MTTEPALTCADVEELAAELAMGGVSGPQRAAALAHLARCDRCRALVDELSAAADSILLLAPSGEAPPGFESRVLSRIAAASQPIPLRRPPAHRRRLWAGAAAVALVAALAGLGVGELRHRAGSGDGGVAAGAPTAGLRTALVSDADGRWTCRAVVYGDSPTWLVVSLDRTDGANAGFSVEAVRVGSPETVPVGSFAIADGHGTLATPVGLKADELQAVRVLDQTGRVRYEATFVASA